MTNNRTETQEFKQEFLRMASYIDCLLECSDEQKETLMNFISRLSEYMPWYEDDNFDIEETSDKRTVLTDSEREICKMFLEDLNHNCNEYKLLMSLIDESESVETPDKRTETHSCDCNRKETHGDVISRAAAMTEIQMNAKRLTLAYEAHGEGLVQFSDSVIGVREASDILRDLPSAEPEQRPATEDDYAYCAECDHVEMCRWYPMYGCEFRDLPSAEPEIITCKDCKWWSKSPLRIDRRCSIFNVNTSMTFFCKHGRRENE